MHSSTCSWPFARSLTRSRRYFFFFALHSPLTRFGQCFGSLGLNCGDRTGFQITSSSAPFWPYHHPRNIRLQNERKSARLIWTKFIHWRWILSSFRKKWVECPVLFELLQDPTTHRFTIVKTEKYSCRKLDNTRACKGPKDVFDFRWAEIPLVTSQQRWRNQNGGRSELSEVISWVKMRLYRKKDKRFMKYFRYTFYSYQTKLKHFWVYMPFKLRIPPEYGWGTGPAIYSPLNADEVWVIRTKYSFCILFFLSEFWNFLH